MTDIVEEEPRPPLRERVGVALDRAERVYLKVLRAAILLIATGLLLYAAWLGVSGVWKVMRSPDSVEEETAAVAADEITDAEMPARRPERQEGPRIDPNQQRYYTGFVNRYYALFRSRFEPFRQREDKRLSRDEFDDAFIDSQARLQTAARGNLNFAADRADLETLLRVMTEAAEKPVTRQRLQRYKNARKVRVGRRVQRTRTEYRSGWNRYSMACADWYYPPYGCAERRAVQVPYTQTVYSREFPEGTQSHNQIFRAFQDRFFALLQQRRADNRLRAEMERNDIMIGNVEGRVSLWDALKILGGFLLLMFFFLLIAIERHQRRMVGGAERLTEQRSRRPTRSA
jgi:hypothetical protein